MKQQFVGFVLSALLFTTFGHEILTRHKQERSERILNSQPKSSLLFHTRKNSDEKNYNQPFGNLRVSYNPTRGLVSIVNETTQVGLVIDTSANLAAIFFQPNETLILINWETSSGVVISGKATKEVGWHTEDTFQTYFEKNTSLATYWSFGEKNSGKFEISAVKSEIAVLIQSALMVLSSGDYFVPEHEAAGLLAKLSASWAAAIKKTSGLVEGGSVTAKTSLRLAIGAYQGLALIVSRVKWERYPIIKKHITVSLKTLIKVKSSYVLTAYLVVAFVKKGINSEEIIGDVVNNGATVCELITVAGGNSSEGLTGFMRVILEFVLVAHNQGSVQGVIVTLIDFYTNNPNLNYKQFVKRFEEGINNIIQIIKRAHVKSQLKGWIKNLEAILAHKLKENDVDMSLIIKSLLATDGSTPLERIVRAIIILQKKAIPETIGYLFYKLFEYLVENQIDVIITIYPKVKFNGNDKNVIANILRYLNTTELSSKDDCIHALSKVPVITDIVQRVNNTLGEFTNGSITLNLLVRSESFFKYIKLIEQIIANIKNKGQTTTEAPSDDDDNSSDQPSKSSSHETGDSNGKGKGGDGGNVEISGVGNGNSENTNLQVDNGGGKGGDVNSEGGHEVHNHDGSGPDSENFKGGNSSVDVGGGKGGDTKVTDTGNGSKNTNVLIDSNGGNSGNGSSKGGDARSNHKERHHAEGHGKQKEKH